MVQINQQVEDANNHRSAGTTTSNTASKEAELKLEMIRLYEGKFEDDNNRGSSVSENLCNTESSSTSQSLQLKFLNGICTTVYTGEIIEGDEEKPFVVALVDVTTGQIVTTGAEAAMEVEIVVLEGDANDDEADNWTSDEFNNRVVSKWNERKVLKGNTVAKLNEGIVFVDKVSFTHNSSWKGKRKCRMGARSVNAGFLARVKEAKTKAFFLTDKRNLLYKKHEIPSLVDRLYRLHEISHRSNCFKRLSQEHIKTVMDLLTFHTINPQTLKNLLKVSPNKYKIIMDHANMCKDDKSKWVYLYHYPTDGQTVNGVAFNVSGKLVGTIVESRFVPCDKLPVDKRADAQKLIVSSTENWKEVVSFNNQDLLIKHLQSPTTLNTSSNNNLSVVIPQTIDPYNHTTLTSPKTQSPKRLASEHVISNSTKQPRYDHPKLTSYTRSVDICTTSNCHKAKGLDLPQGDDDMEYLKYLNLPADTWKIVCYAVGWICIISKPRKRRTTVVMKIQL